MTNMPPRMMEELRRKAEEELRRRGVVGQKETDGKPLPGSEIPWQIWIPKYFPHVASKPMVQRHVDLHEWFDGLERGVKPPPSVQPWARGSAKSSSGELGVTRVGAKLTRRFALYVSLTQAQADYHVQAIGSHLERVGAMPKLTAMGRARGWRRDQLQTEHGFNVAGFGMDSALRGIKIDEFRPDLIWLDDVDSLEDTLDTIDKKIRAITLNLLPAGSTDCAILFTGNKVHAGSIIARLIDGRAKFLLNRVVGEAVPAVYDLETEEYVGDNGLNQFRIIGGTASWPGGQPLETCQLQMNEWGYPSFMREAQHDVRVGGTFFPQFEDKEPYVITPIFTPTNQPPHWYTFRFGLDWGYADPYAYVLSAIDETGRKHILESHEQVGLKNETQASQLVAACTRWGIPIRNVHVIADGTMWNKKTVSGVQYPADIDAFIKAGFKCIPAEVGKKADQFRNSNLRNLMREDGRGMVVYRGFNNRLIECIMGAKHDNAPGRVEQVLHDECSHMVVALGNSVSSYDQKIASEPITKVQTVEQLQAGVEVMSSDFLASQMAEMIGMYPKRVKGKVNEFERDERGNLVFEKRSRGRQMQRPYGT